MAAREMTIWVLYRASMLAATLLVLLGLLALGGRAMGQSASDDLKGITVRVLPNAEVAGDTFTLGEIAELDGFDLKRVQRLATVEIGRSPRPGYALRLNETYLRSRLAREANLDGVTLAVPERTQVTRASQHIAAQEIERRVLAFAKAEAPVGGKNLEQKVLTRLQPLDLPLGDVSWTIEPVGQHLVPGGTRSYRVGAKVNDQSAWRGLVRVEQSVYRTVVVAATPIRRNATIEAGDVTMQRLDVSQVKDETYLTDVADVVGKKAHRPIGPGEWIHAGMVDMPASVREGSRVTVVYETDRLLFQVPGVALAQGQVGDFIPVRNLQSGTIVYGVVGSDEQVKVN